MKWGVAKEMEFDNENDRDNNEEKNEANQTGAESNHQEGRLALGGSAVFLVPDSKSIARR